MQRRELELPRSKSKAVENSRPVVCPFPHHNRRVVHDVTDVVNADADALPRKICDRGLGRAKQPAADVIGKHAIDLLGHRLKGAKPRLHMRDRNIELGRGQRAGQRRVCIAVNKDGVGPLLKHNALQRNDHAAGHFAVRTAIDAQANGAASACPAPRRKYPTFRDRSAGRCEPEFRSGFRAGRSRGRAAPI